MTPFIFTVESRYTYFIWIHYKLIENVKIEEGTLLNSSNDSLDPYDYHLSKNGLDCFKKLLEFNRIHSSWLGVERSFIEENFEEEEDVEGDVNLHELENTDGSNEVVKVSNRKCVTCLKRDSDSIFEHCGHQCVCEKWYQNKSDIDIIKFLICRT